MSEDTGQRYGFVAFECAPALRLQAHEKVAALQFAHLNGRLDKIEEMMARLEKRLWLALFGMIAAILTQTLQQVLSVTP
jgi:hypothetical protein